MLSKGPGGRPSQGNPDRVADAQCDEDLRAAADAGDGPGAHEVADTVLAPKERDLSETSLRKLSMHAGEEDAPAQLEAMTA